jgi:hypothetical protein
MEYIDSYLREVFHICKAYNDPAISQTLKQSIKTDPIKAMFIGSILAISFRFCMYKRFYLLKDYVRSVMYGSLFGLSYSPYFLGKKVDEEYMLKIFEA